MLNNYVALNEQEQMLIKLLSVCLVNELEMASYTSDYLSNSI